MFREDGSKADIGKEDAVILFQANRNKTCQETNCDADTGAGIHAW